MTQVDFCFHFADDLESVSETRACAHLPNVGDTIEFASSEGHYGGTFIVTERVMNVMDDPSVPGWRIECEPAPGAFYVHAALGHETQVCAVEGCKRPADYEVLLYDKYRNGEEFDDRDFTCPFLCSGHHTENEAGINGTRTPREVTSYPFTNGNGAQGFSKYRKLK